MFYPLTPPPTFPISFSLKYCCACPATLRSARPCLYESDLSVLWGPLLNRCPQLFVWLTEWCVFKECRVCDSVACLLKWIRCSVAISWDTCDSNSSCVRERLVDKGCCRRAQLSSESFFIKKMFSFNHYCLSHCDCISISMRLCNAVCLPSNLATSSFSVSAFSKVAMCQ